MTTTGRVARLTALALATGTLIATGSTAANAATTPDGIITAGNISAAKTVLGGAGNGVIRLELNLPVGIDGLLPKHIVQDIVVTKSNTRSGTDKAAVASALLGENGNVPLLSQLLSGGQTATLGSGTKDTTPNAGLASLLGSLGLLKFTSEVADPNSVGTIAHSVSSIADLKIGDAAVLNSILGPLQAALDSALGSLQLAPSASSTGSTDTVTGVVNTLFGTVKQVTDSLGTPVASDVLAQVQTLLSGLLSQLNTALDLKTALDTDEGLINIGLIKSEETVTRTAAGVVTSINDNKLADVSLLGGLVKASALTSTARAALDKNGNPVDLGPAASSGDLLSLNVADILVARVTDQLQVILGGLGSALQPVLDAVNTLLATLTDLTENLLGFSFKQGAAGPTVAKKNQSEQSAAAAVLTLNPPLLSGLLDGPLLQAAFVPATSSVVRAEAAVPPTVVPTPTSVTSLPRTGAELPLTGAAAAALMGLALVARRRRLAHIEG
jgi:hypothetical protein